MLPEEVEGLLKRAGARSFWEGPFAIINSGKNVPESDLLWSLGEFYTGKITGKIDAGFQKSVVKGVQGLLDHPSFHVRLQAALLIGQDLEDPRIAEILVDALQRNPENFVLKIKVAPILYHYYREDDPQFIVNLALAFQPNALCQKDDTIPSRGYGCETIDSKDKERLRYTLDNESSPLSGEEVLAWLGLVNDLIDKGIADERFLPLLKATVNFEWYTTSGSYIYLEREVMQTMLELDRGAAIAFAEQKLKAEPNAVNTGGIVEALAKAHIGFGNSGGGRGSRMT